MSRATPHRPPKKHDRTVDGWDLIGFYMQQAEPGVMLLKDPEIATALKWKTSKGLPDDRRVRNTRAQVNSRARREQELGLEVGDKRRVFSGYSFSYRDIKGSPSLLLDPDKALAFNLTSHGIDALFGDMTRLAQGATERERIEQWCRQAAEAANTIGDHDLSFAYLDVEHDMHTFGLIRDTTLTRLRVLLERQP